jgi:phosphoribosylaminoimidazolecarboxamide formyltransferase/IMP cyclohydrolase
VAVGKDALEAYSKAFKTDPTSAFGGILAFNRTVDGATAQAITVANKHFVEVLMAPAYTPEALEFFKSKVNVRVLEIPLDGIQRDGKTAWERGLNSHDIKRIGSGLLIQTADNHELKREDLKVVTKLAPTPQQIEDLLFAWKVAKFVKSNAIVFCTGGMTMGVGAGQMSRLDSARIASIKAEHAGLTLKGTAVASDAFFPFRDGLDVVADAGATCVIQPGGSMRDQEVIDAANERGIAMVFSGVRHFRH